MEHENTLLGCFSGAMWIFNDVNWKALISSAILGVYEVLPLLTTLSSNSPFPRMETRRDRQVISQLCGL